MAATVPIISWLHVLNPKRTMDRRTFLKNAAAAVTYTAVGSAGILFPDETYALGNHRFWQRDRIIEYRRADNNEHGQIKLFDAKQGYLKEGYRQACWALRDAKDGNAMAKMDVQLFNLMYAIQEWARMAGKPNPLITINSGYRTPRRNSRIEGAALNSMHIYGKAADIVVRGIEPWQVAEMAKHFNGGGVGLYGRFTHIDTGRIREWLGRK